VGYRDRVEHALELLAAGLGPFTDRQMRAADGENWAEALFPQGRGPTSAQRLRDPLFLLNVMADGTSARASPSAWRPAFGARLSQVERSVVPELRDARNRRAHHQRFDADDIYRCRRAQWLVCQSPSPPAVGGSRRRR
jgi:hypothetical protein